MKNQGPSSSLCCVKFPCRHRHHSVNSSTWGIKKDCRPWAPVFTEWEIIWGSKWKWTKSDINCIAIEGVPLLPPLPRMVVSNISSCTQSFLCNEDLIYEEPTGKPCLRKYHRKERTVYTWEARMNVVSSRERQVSCWDQKLKGTFDEKFKVVRECVHHSMGIL